MCGSVCEPDPRLAWSSRCPACVELIEHGCILGIWIGLPEQVFGCLKPRHSV
uniref:Uncharacterized protein n=1 Tax=Macrostomum lignano TaxID=282301 RepID=A0A1I8FR88_9PLAT